MDKIQLLTDEQRNVLPEVILKRNKFKSLISRAILNKGSTFSNGIIISGKPGSGKTTLITEFLEEMVSNEKIDHVEPVSGHMTKVSLFQFLKPKNDDDGNHLNTVHLLDDVDCFYNEGCIEILKSALDTRSKHDNNRRVFYNSGYCRDSYYYQDFCIMITNDPFEYVSIHMQAVLDRVHLFKIDMEYDDFVIYNTYIIEKFLNDNEDGLSENVIQQITDFYKSDISKWFQLKVFEKAKVNFSIRLIRKFIDLIIMFESDWKVYSIEYIKLTAAYKDALRSRT